MQSSKIPRRVILLFCLSSIFCFSFAVNAQSRRQSRQKPAEQTTVETPAAQNDNKPDDETDETPVRITSLRIVGELQHDEKFYRSNERDNAIDEFVRTLKLYAKPAPVMTKGGKATYPEAKEQAKKESDTFTLWLGFMAKTDSYGVMYLDVVQYAVFKPKSGKILTRAEIRPEQTRMISPGVRLPAPNARRGSIRMRDEMNDCVRRLAAILARAGWLG